ncbi:sodium-dependent transporter [Salinibius halmophilus]|uniref:sodium-dependent transporter n=1 Tax=Salinibius halmophilus TaxID=1853216 RepID=UPI000E66B916|nr:sodium-dependent transporter [Salinibius halmophilus]
MQNNNIWSHRWTFILAAVGSAVGLGNLWKFPYITGEYGGGAFVLVYLVTIALIGVPVFMAESLLGRKSRKSPVDGVTKLAKENGATPLWGGVGIMGAFTGVLILSFYSVIAGWAIHYFIRFATGALVGIDADAAGAELGNLFASPVNLTIYHTLFMAATMFIIGLGVHKGLERGVNVLLPLLFVMLIVVAIYAGINGDFGAAASFLFSFELSKLSLEGWLAALGHAFFTLSLGMGSIFVYGSYMSSESSLAKTAVTVAVLDTVVALIAGLAIFSLIFGNGLEASQGPGLLFVSLPLAFAEMPGSAFFGAFFMALVLFAALSSSISILEPIVAFFVSKGVNRVLTTLVVGLFVWLVGMLTVFSFNVLAGFTPIGEWTMFDIFDKLTSNVTLPLGGVLLSLFAAWVLTKETLVAQIPNDTVRMIWIALARFVAPLGVTFVMLKALSVPMLWALVAAVAFVALVSVVQVKAGAARQA